MKTWLKIGICLLLAVGFASCDKDETPVVGRLKLNYEKAPVITKVYIYTETGNTIYTKVNPGTSFSMDLNPGNYGILSSTSSGGGGKEYFQIQAGRTTNITYDGGLSAVVKYE